MKIASSGRVAAVLLLAVCVPVFAQVISLRDDRGATVALSAPAQRIVTLSPHLAEVVFAAGAGERLVGVARFSDFPDAVRDLPQIGDAARIDLERVLVLKPDLVLAWKSGNPASDIAALERLGYPVYVSETARLEDVPRVLRAIGALAGTMQSAEKAATAFERGISALRERYSQRRVLRVFYQIWDRPLFTVNRDQIISDILTVCSGYNIFANAPALVPAVSVEAVVAARPDVILGGSELDSRQGFVESWQHTVLASLQRVPVYYVPPQLVQRQTPRVLEGTALICRDLDDARIRQRGGR
ncbi:MAG TPA: helical backbone metal receptor [Burkholderiales bacterium]|nr:helical backbone metal receptor [Burkholderiales bacterium]